MQRAVGLGTLFHAVAAAVGGCASWLFIADPGSLIVIALCGGMWGVVSSFVAYALTASRPWVTTGWIWVSGILTLFAAYLSTYGFFARGCDC